jgi:hypothetical protein
MLLESSRKLWVGIIINRIKGWWNKRNLLDDCQHGFRANHGTCTATIQIIDLLEANRVSHSDLLVSSWDMKRAFDSVGKQVQVLSWNRLGVPLHLATYLANMDSGGCTVVRTPLAQCAWEKCGYKGFSTSETDPYRPEFFDCDRGTGQGDVGSPTCWAGFMDILLTALGTIVDDLFCTNGLNECVAATENAFADDLLSFAASVKTLQCKADIVSAFAAIFGMEIRSDKLRLFRYTFSNDVHTDLDERVIILHRLMGSTWVWDSVVPVDIITGDQRDNQLKHLGVIHDPAGYYDVQFANTLELIKREVMLITCSKADPIDKFLALRIRS